MIARNVEVVNGIAQMVLVAQNASPRIGDQLELQAMLDSLGDGLHPHLHHALADRRAVPEPRRVSYREVHGSNPALTVGRSQASTSLCLSDKRYRSGRTPSGSPNTAVGCL